LRGIKGEGDWGRGVVYKVAKGQEGKRARRQRTISHLAVLPSCPITIRRNVNYFLKHALIPSEIERIVGHDRHQNEISSYYFC
jgi:hypothetical protein